MQVNLSDPLVALVPPAVVTVTSTLPAAGTFGEVTVICVAEFTVTLVAETVPNLTAVAPVRFVPVMVTVVPPVATPELGDTLVTLGGGIGEGEGEGDGEGEGVGVGEDEPDVTVIWAGPLTLPNAAVMVVLPPAVPAVASPLLLMVATPVADELHVTSSVTGALVPSLRLAVALNC